MNVASSTTVWAVRDVHKPLGYIFGNLWVDGKYIYLENILKKFWDEIQKLSSWELWVTNLDILSDVWTKKSFC